MLTRILDSGLVRREAHAGFINLLKEFEAYFR
jgi:hypothetical protein